MVKYILTLVLGLLVGAALMYWLGPQKVKVITRTTVLNQGQAAPQAEPLPAAPAVSSQAQATTPEAMPSLQQRLAALVDPALAPQGQVVDRPAVKAAMAQVFQRRLDKKLDDDQLESLAQALDTLAEANQRMNELGTPDDNDLNHWRERQAAQTQVLQADARFRAVAGISLSDFISLADQDGGVIHDLGR